LEKPRNFRVLAKEFSNFKSTMCLISEHAKFISEHAKFDVLIMRFDRKIGGVDKMYNTYSVFVY
jgi:ribosomal protein L16 Arg81 hydroxylase